MILVAAVWNCPATRLPAPSTPLCPRVPACVVDTGLSFSSFQLKRAQLENRKQFFASNDPKGKWKGRGEGERREGGKYANVQNNCKLIMHNKPSLSLTHKSHERPPQLPLNCCYNCSAPPRPQIHLPQHPPSPGPAT